MSITVFLAMLSSHRIRNMRYNIKPPSGKRGYVSFKKPNQFIKVRRKFTWALCKKGIYSL